MWPFVWFCLAALTSLRLFNASLLTLLYQPHPTFPAGESERLPACSGSNQNGCLPVVAYVSKVDAAILPFDQLSVAQQLIAHAPSAEAQAQTRGKAIVVRLAMPSFTFHSSLYFFDFGFGSLPARLPTF